jgi:hypothetical protein
MDVAEYQHPLAIANDANPQTAGLTIELRHDKKPLMIPRSRCRVKCLYGNETPTQPDSTSSCHGDITQANGSGCTMQLGRIDPLNPVITLDPAE